MSKKKENEATENTAPQTSDASKNSAEAYRARTEKRAESIKNSTTTDTYKSVGISKPGDQTYKEQQEQYRKQYTSQSGKTGKTTTAGKNKRKSYLSGGETNSEQTQSYLDQVTEELNKSRDEKTIAALLEEQDAFQKQLKIDQSNEKKEKSLINRLRKKGDAVDPYAGYITDDVTAANAEAAKAEKPEEELPKEAKLDRRLEANEKRIEAADKGVNPEWGKLTKEERRAKQLERDALVREWNSTHDPKTKAQIDELDQDLDRDEEVQKQEKKDSISAWWETTKANTQAWFKRPGKEDPQEQVETPDEEKSEKDKVDEWRAKKKAEEREKLVEQYQDAVQADLEASTYADNPLGEQYAAEAKATRAALREQLKEANRAAGLDIYDGLADEDRAEGMSAGFLGDRYAGVLGFAGSQLGGVDDYVNGFIDDHHRELVMAQANAAWAHDYAEADRLQEEVDRYEEEHRGENQTFIGDVGETLLNKGKEIQTSADTAWAEATAGLSDAERAAANVGKGVSNIILDMMTPVGRARMYASAGGHAAFEQMDRDNNSPEAVATAALLGSAAAWAAEKTFGRAELAYGKSIFGNLTDKVIGNLPKTLQVGVRALFTTEPAEDALEDGLRMVGDRILNLDPESRIDWNEKKQTMAYSYFTSVFFNLLTGGATIDSAKREAIADEAIEAADFLANGGDPKELAEIAMENTRDQVVAKLNPEQIAEAEQNVNSEAEAETNAEANPAETQTEKPKYGEPGWVDPMGEDIDESTAPLDQRMEHGDVSIEEFQDLIDTEEGRQELADILGLESADRENVEAGVALYLYAQEKLNNQNADTEAEPQDTAEPQETAPPPPQKWHGLPNVVMDSDAAAIQMINDGGKVGYNLWTRTNQNTNGGKFQYFGDSYEEAKAAYDKINEERGTAGSSVWRLNNGEDVNSQPEETNAENPALNAPEEPSEQTEGQNAQYDAQNPFGVGQEQTNTQSTQNAQGEGKKSVPLAQDTPENKRQKISQYFTNTLTESARTEGLDPVTYNPTSEAESLTNAAMRLSADKQAVLESLMNSPAWDGEMVDSAWLIENEIYKEFLKTGDRSEWDAWRKIETHKISQTAKGLQAVAKQSRPNAVSVLNSIMNTVESIRQANAEAKKNGNTKAVVDEKVLTKAEQKANDIAQRLGKLENQVDEAVKGGMSEAEAKNSVKDAYLDIIDEINTFRHTGLFQDANQQAGARADEKAGKEIRKLNTKFRKMLANEDIDYIMRFAACDAAGISEDLNYKGEKDVLKRLNTWQKLAQLTGTGTWLRNGIGNGSFGIIDVLSADNPITWIADALVGKKTGRRSSGFETGFLNKDARQAASRALNRSILEVAANIDLASDPDMSKYDMKQIRSYDPDGKALERVVSRWEQWNGYMLQSSDAWFKGMAEGSAESAIRKANKWGDDNLTDAERNTMDPEKAKALSQSRQAQLDEVKQQIAEYRTFQNNGVTATGANDIRDWLNKKGAELVGKDWEKGQFGLGTALMPYTKVPTNLAVKSLEFSPLGAAKGIAEMVKVVTDPNSTMAQQNKAVTDFGRGVTGTMLIAGLSYLMKKIPVFKDWDAEDDKDVKAQNKAEGKSGMQINLSALGRWLNGDKDVKWNNDDRTLDISSMEPFNQLLATASLIAEGKNPAQAFWESSRDSALNMPALQTISNIENSIRYTDTPESGWQTLANTAASTAGSVVGGMNPAPIRHLATVTDPYVRDTSGNNPIERSWNQIIGGIPGARQTLPVKTDSFGNEMTSGDAATRVANQYDSFKHSQVNQGDVSREIERIRNETGVSLMPDRNGPKKVSFGTGDDKTEQTLTAKERKLWKDNYGKEFERDMKVMMNNRSNAYNAVDSDIQAEIGAEVGKFVTENVKNNYAKDHGLPEKSDYDEIRELDNPLSYIAANKAFNSAKGDGKWDVVDQLMAPISKLGDKEQELMRDKNPTAMNYYDFLTPNDYGFKADSAESVYDYKTASNENAKARGVQSASGVDKLAAIKQGLKDGTMSIADANAFFTKQQSDGDYDLSKGRATIWVSAHPKTVDEALKAIAAIENADKDKSGGLDQWGYKKKAQYEVSNAIKANGYDMNVFDYIYRGGNK